MMIENWKEWINEKVANMDGECIFDEFHENTQQLIFQNGFRSSYKLEKKSYEELLKRLENEHFQLLGYYFKETYTAWNSMPNKLVTKSERMHIQKESYLFDVSITYSTVRNAIYINLEILSS